MLRRVLRQSRLASGLFSQASSSMFRSPQAYCLLQIRSRQFLTSTALKNAIILAGSNMRGLDNLALSSCSLSGVKTTHITKENKPFDIHFKLRENITSTPQRTLLFIMAHGYVERYVETGRHRISLNDKLIETRKIFKIIKQIGTPVDIINVSCFGGAACRDAVKYLPDTSTYLALSHANEPTYFVDVMKALQPNILNIPEYLLIRFLTKMQGGSTPCISYIGGQTGDKILSLREEFYERLGKKFSDDEKAAIYLELKPYVSEEELVRTVNRIENNQLFSFTFSDIGNYGTALATVYIAEKARHTQNMKLIQKHTHSENRTSFFKSVSETSNQNEKEEKRENNQNHLSP